ncbi:O-methyltransferase [Rhizodiscina lignyota]|uniref:O-methyltransferase n=1 Tax=Rhizodiscina lignyota TaxID=1504668 RepID=A0A9P4M2U0_9PEZI|nr:O-methyltransferase [Rhizodiscina lignyota]
MEALTEAVRRVAQSADESERKQLLDSLRDLAYDIERPQDTFERVNYYNLRLAVIRIGIELKLFEIISAGSKPLTTGEIAEKVNAAPPLLRRILRYMASMGMIQEAGPDTFRCIKATQNLATVDVRAGVLHNFENVNAAFQALPSFLQRNSYREITDIKHTPYQQGWNTELTTFQWMQQNPQHMAWMSDYMAVSHSGKRSWLDAYPFSLKSQDVDSERVVFVDVGGGIGHQCISLRESHPQLTGRVVLQDLKEVVEQANVPETIEVIAHNFFDPQPVQGAKFYYLRNVLHDWSDDKCILILKHLIASMTSDSMILIDEMVLPDIGAHWHATQYDLTMMVALAAQERTRSQWEALLDQAGLQITSVHCYTKTVAESIIEAVSK